MSSTATSSARSAGTRASTRSTTAKASRARAAGTPSSASNGRTAAPSSAPSARPRSMRAAPGGGLYGKPGVFLKSLTLKGFKSFAETTTLEFEPGVTVVVGPNGSGKSNIVDAVAWVLGAQGPSTVRSSKMEDVIFAGSSKRPALARPEVRRTVIEEAAGVLKYRRRKEKAERRLDGTEANLVRLQDLLREVRRQRRPLERQAEAARRHGEVAAELAALQLYLAGREV